MRIKLSITMTETMSQEAHILIVEDEHNIRMTLAGILKSLYEVTLAESGEEALTLTSESAFDLILLDIHLPGMSGLEVLETIQHQHPQVIVIILTGYASVDNAVRAMRNGAVDYLQKPASQDEILESVQAGLIERQRERRRNAVLMKARKLLSEGLAELEQVVPEHVDLLAEADADAAEQTLDPDRFLQRGPLIIDTYRRKATLHGELLDLTGGEYDLLLCLAQDAPQVLGPRELVYRTRGYECSLSEAREIVRWQVYLLRQKVEADPSSPQYVLNVRGKGYMWAGG